MKTRFASLMWGVIITTGIILLIFFIKIISSGLGFWTGSIALDSTGQAGDFIGGVIGTIFSAGAFIWAYITLIEQQKKQSDDRLENRFFELLELHRRNVDEMEFDATGRINDPNTLSVTNRRHKGKAVFREVFRQITSCRNELAPFFKNVDEIYEPGYLETVKANPFIIENGIKDYVVLALIDVSYCIVFFGVGAEGKQVLKSLFDNKYKKRFISQVVDYISLKPAEDKDKYYRWAFIQDRKVITRRLEISEAIKLARNKQPYSGNHLRKEDDQYIKGFDSHYVKYYGGHQFRLGHYFRHLYQTVRYMNERVDVPYGEKYGYIKLLRAQLSNYEQAILFFNSLSQLGRKWEMEALINPQCKGYSRFDFELITKYCLIKNIPNGAQLGIEPNQFYTQIDYEYNSTPIKRRDYK